MGKPLSADLRERIVAEVERGTSRRGAAVRFGVAASTTVRLQARYEETGCVAPARIGRPRDSGKPGPHRAFIIAHVQDKPDITMLELAALLLDECGVEIDPSNLSKFLCRAGFTYKKHFWHRRKNAPMSGLSAMNGTNITCRR